MCVCFVETIRFSKLTVIGAGRCFFKYLTHPHTNIGSSNCFSLCKIHTQHTRTETPLARSLSKPRPPTKLARHSIRPQTAVSKLGCSTIGMYTEDYTTAHCVLNIMSSYTQPLDQGKRECIKGGIKELTSCVVG